MRRGARSGRCSRWRSPPRSACCSAMPSTVTTLAVPVTRRAPAGSRRTASGIFAAGARGRRGACVLRGRLCSSADDATRLRGAPTHPPLTVVSSGLRVRLIAIDGFDPRIARRLAARAAAYRRSPRLSAARRAAHRGGDTARSGAGVDHDRDGPAAGGPRRPRPRDATGRRGAGQLRHRGRAGSCAAIARGHGSVRLTRPAIASGSERRVEDVLGGGGGAGLRTVVVNWWATWPAPGNAASWSPIGRCCGSSTAGARRRDAPPASYDRAAAAWPALRHARRRRTRRHSATGAEMRSRLLRRSRGARRAASSAFADAR